MLSEAQKRAKREKAAAARRAQAGRKPTSADLYGTLGQASPELCRLIRRALRDRDGR